MEPTTLIRQSPVGDGGHRLFFLRLATMVACLFVTALGTSSAVMGAATPPQVPLFTEAPSVAPPAIAQALPAPRTLKRWIRQQRPMTLNPAALEIMNRLRTEARTDVMLNLFDIGPRTLDLDQPREHPNQTKVWRGRLRGEAGSDVTLVVHGTTIVGTILSNQRLYKIESTGGTLHHLIEIDEEALPPDDHPLVVADDDPNTPPSHGRHLTTNGDHCRSSR